MRTFQEIAANIRVHNIQEMGEAFTGSQMFGCSVYFPDTERIFIVCWSVDCEPGDDGVQWEHVSVSRADSRRKTATWEEMCRIKDIFWTEDEEVHQIHPRADEYVHGVSDLTNVLHLWRPVGGWKL